MRATLLAARARRVPPGRDDKVVAAWNGLAIAALAECGAYFDRPDLVEAASETARLLRDVHWRDGRLRRTSREGRAGDNAGVLEDYADLAEGLITLYGVTGDAAHAEFAGELLDVVLDRFADGQGGFFDTADDAERLWKRPQDPTDNATPSGQFAAAGALLSYAALTALGATLTAPAPVKCTASSPSRAVRSSSDHAAPPSPSRSLLASISSRKASRKRRAAACSRGEGAARAMMAERRR